MALRLLRLSNNSLLFLGDQIFLQSIIKLSINQFVVAREFNIWEVPVIFMVRQNLVFCG